jgi:Zn-dependent peptidase ImmA (M78 family)
MTVRVPVAASVLRWALTVSSTPADVVRGRLRVDAWITGTVLPTVKQLRQFASATGVPFGYLLLDAPPEWALPVPDFREGFAGERETPSANLLAVVGQSLRRQEWYRDYATYHGLPPVEVVASAGEQAPREVAASIRRHLSYEVSDRRGSWNDTRKSLLRSFEDIGGLTVATSMVGNNTNRLLDPDEFRGFALSDDLAPLIFVNTTQTLNGQIFTIAHELAHIWKGQSGISNEDPRYVAQSDIERWCNAVASEVLVPQADLIRRYEAVRDLELTEQLERLASAYKCGTLVVLQAVRRGGLRQFEDFDAAYDAELRRLMELQQDRPSSGGDHYRNQPFRVGERLSRALIADSFEGRTSVSEAMSLMSVKSLSTFDEYARRLGAA